MRRIHTLAHGLLLLSHYHRALLRLDTPRLVPFDPIYNAVEERMKPRFLRQWASAQHLILRMRTDLPESHHPQTLHAPSMDTTRASEEVEYICFVYLCSMQNDRCVVCRVGRPIFIHFSPHPLYTLYPLIPLSPYPALPGLDAGHTQCVVLVVARCERF